MLISEALGLGGLIKKEGYILQAQGYEVIDLGDDIYTPVSYTHLQRGVPPVRHLYDLHKPLKELF